MCYIIEGAKKPRIEGRKTSPDAVQYNHGRETEVTMEKRITKKRAKEIIEFYRKNGETNYFSGCIGSKDMLEMLRFRMGFGDAESNVILAALIYAGAEFHN